MKMLVLMMIKSLPAWLLIIPLAILNGVLRDTLLSPWLGPQVALPLSGVLLCGLILLVAAFALPRLVRGPARLFWWIGLFWMLLTVLFESAFGLANGSTVRQLLTAYDVTSGNLWLLVVLYTAIAPWIGAKWHGACLN